MSNWMDEVENTAAKLRADGPAITSKWWTAVARSWGDASPVPNAVTDYVDSAGVVVCEGFARADEANTYVSVRAMNLDSEDGGLAIRIQIDFMRDVSFYVDEKIDGPELARIADSAVALVRSIPGMFG